ncbi:MAG: sugar phosphate isomerase/epimerase [Pirellula sp.]|nr:sugar phosphate isomerase/epimerase [Pirellula sp.]
MQSAITVSLVPQAVRGPFVFHGNFADSARVASRIGFDAIEIFPPFADALNTAETQSVLADCGLSLAALGTGAGWLVHRRSLAHPDHQARSEAIDFVRRIMDVASEFHAPAIIGSMQGKSGDGVTLDQARGLLRESLEALDAHAAASNGKLLYEPLNRYETDQCNTLEQGAAMIRDLPNVRLLADWFHMNIEEADMAQALRQFGSAIGHIHFADTNRRAVGLGHLDAQPLIQTLRQIGYTGYLSAEVFPYPTSEEAARQTADAYIKLVKTDS